MSFLRPLESFNGLFHCLLGNAHAPSGDLSDVVGSGITTRLGGELVELSSSQVRVILHSVCHLQSPYELRVSVIHPLCNSEHPYGCQPLSTGFSFAPRMPLDGDPDV
jgi:hypothetical protein